MTEKLKVLDLFSGIGGFSLGLERTGGFETVAFCEIEEFPRKVLKKHWPNVPCYHDVRKLTADVLKRDGISVDVITAGFPCQDVSIAGKGAGINANRTGLWREIVRIAHEKKPKFIILENVSKIRSRGLEEVLIALSKIGYDAEWHCIPASHVGAPHRRDRIWIIAYGKEYSLSSNTNIIGLYTQEMHINGSAELLNEQKRNSGQMAWRNTKPPVQRVVDGIPTRLDIDRIKAVGNSVLPQIPEMIGRAILEMMND